MGNNKIIVVNTRFLLKDKLEGIGWFTYETIRRIVLTNPEITFHFLFDRPFDASFVFAKNVKPIVLNPPARHPILWFLWFQWSVKRYLQKTKPDLFISTDGYMSLGTKVPTLLVIHDLAFEHFPEQVPWLTNLYYRFFTKKFALAAAKIATVSNFSKQDIIHQYGIDPQKIDVVYNGANELYSPLEAATQLATKLECTEGNDYFLYTGSIHPRKNLHNILRAFDLFKKSNENKIKLLIVGRKAWQYGEVLGVYEAMKHKEDVIFTGHIQPTVLSRYMASAIALIYTSYFEGFGIPIIEAMQSGTPVITSNISVMPETAGDAALLVDPYKPEMIAEAMTHLFKDPTLRKKLSIQGLEHAKKFSWQKTADALWKAAYPLIS